MSSEVVGLFTGAIVLGLIHGIEPGHGWPVAASAALDQPRKWLWGLAASFLLGIGHLISSIAVVLLFFFAKNYFDLNKLNEPVILPGGLHIAGPLGIGAGILLIGLGIWEYVSSHSHTHGHNSSHHHEHPHPEDEDRHVHSHQEETDTHRSEHESSPHGHVHTSHDQHVEDVKQRGLWGIVGFAFLLGFIHEEEFEIIGLCAGSTLCLELMIAYAITVIVGIVGMTMLMIAGFHHFEKRVLHIEPYLPHISAGILVVMGVGFITGFF